ncbi:MAG: TIGR00266 family protein [Myxococcota bacterium]
MNTEILYRPGQSLARVTLAAGEAIVAESGAMVGMSTHVAIHTSARGGLLAGAQRWLGGESFFVNTFTAQGAPGELLLAPRVCGDMTILDVGDGASWHLQSSAFVAAAPDVHIETGLGGFRTFFAGEGLFVLRASGRGPLLCGAFGALERIDVDGKTIIDTGHLVAWDATLEWRVTTATSGLLASFFSGEGLVCEFTGRGTVWIQTRNPAEYGPAVARLLPPREQ